VFIKRKKRNSLIITYGEIKCPKSGFLLIIIGWGELGKVILQVAGRCQKKFGAKMAQTP